MVYSRVNKCQNIQDYKIIPIKVFSLHCRVQVVKDGFIKHLLLHTCFFPHHRTLCSARKEKINQQTETQVRQKTKIDGFIKLNRENGKVH